MLDLRPSRLDQPDAHALTEEVQAYYVEIYGGRDEDPLEPDTFAPPRGGFLIGYLGGLPLAMGGWTFSGPDLASAQLRRMFVRPEARRHGYAEQLLRALEDDARTAGARRAILTTGTRQASAVAFYRACGYDDVAPFGFYASSPGAVFLGRPLVGEDVTISGATERVHRA